MERFDRTDEASSKENRMPSERLAAFTKAIWDALVPASGSCASVQGELVRANERLQSELLRNGMGNYFRRDDPEKTLADNHYGALLLFMLDTMAENRGQALSDDDVSYFTEVRRDIEPQWLRGLRSDELYYRAENEDEEELTDAERAELAQIDPLPRGPNWEDLFNRAERCIANWCLANKALVDREGKPVTERGVSDVIHIFEPPSPPPVCALCNGRGWLPPTSPGSGSSFCSCQKK